MLSRMEAINWAWIVPGGYALISCIFFAFPTLIRKKKQTHIQTFNIGHRGGSGEATENTLGAFKNAVKCGSGMLELDVRLSRDHKVAVTHDGDFLRIADSYQLVKETNYEDFPLYKCDIPLVFSRNQRVLHKDKQQDRRIPLLCEVFDTFPDMPINIDIKIEDDELIKQVAEMVRGRKREGLTVWGSFSESTAKKCYQENPDIPMFCSLRKVVWLTVCFYLGLLPFVSIKETYLELPLLTSASFQAVIPKKRLTRAIIATANFLLINRLFFWHLKARGMKIFVWVLNEEEEFERARRLGVDAIMTDFPSKLAHYISLHPPSIPSPISLHPPSIPSPIFLHPPSIPSPNTQNPPLLNPSPKHQQPIMNSLARTSISTAALLTSPDTSNNRDDDDDDEDKDTDDDMKVKKRKLTQKSGRNEDANLNG